MYVHICIYRWMYRVRVSREKGGMCYIGLIFPYSLLCPSKFKRQADRTVTQPRLIRWGNTSQATTEALSTSRKRTKGARSI